MTEHTAKRSAAGMVLLEALVGLLIFSIGILAFVAMQAEAIRNTSEARYRNEAAYLANQIIGRMWADRTNLAAYSHRPGGTPCSPTGNASTEPRVESWLYDVINTLYPPNTSPANVKAQIIIGASNLVTVGICWDTGSAPHNLVVNAQIRG